METQRRPRVVTVIDPNEERLKELFRTCDLVERIMNEPRLSFQKTINILTTGLRRAGRRYIIHNSGYDDRKVESYSKVTELYTENPCEYLSIANVLYEGDDERTIAIYVRERMKRSPPCLIA